MADSAIDRVLGRAQEVPKDAIQSIIFGYGYRARSGKDTVAAMIKDSRGNGYPGRLSSPNTPVENTYDIRIYSFAQELKREVNENAMKSGGMIKLFDPGLRDEMGGYLQENGNILPLPEWVQYDPDPPMDDPHCPYGKQRTLLQFWGTEYRRSVNQDYWVNKVAKSIAEEKPEIALITDVRFLNEIRFCQKYGEVVKVHRPTIKELIGAAGLHPSETALDNFNDWDDVILNDSDLNTLRERALFSFDMLLSSHPVSASSLGVI